MKAIAWNKQFIDGAMHKAQRATECGEPNPMNRGHDGRKRILLVKGAGVPLAIIASGINTHNARLLSHAEPAGDGDAGLSVTVQSLCRC